MSHRNRHWRGCCHIIIGALWDGGGDKIHPLLESVEWCKPIGHQHTLTHIHTTYSPRHYLIGYMLCRSVVFAPCGLGEDKIRPLLGSVEWYDPVELGTFPQWDGGGEFTHCSRVQGGTTPQVGL